MLTLSTFYLINLCIHAPVHGFFFLVHLIDPRRNKANRKAIAKGWPPVLVGLLQLYCHLTTCTHLVTVTYFALSWHGGYPIARHVVKAINTPLATIVGVFWRVLSRALA